MLKDGQRLAVHNKPKHINILFLNPKQEPPLGQEWTVYGPQRGPWLTPGSIRVAGGNPETIAALGLGEAASAPHPKAAEFQKLVDGLRDRHPKLETYRPGSPTPERAPADYHPAEYTTPEQGTELEERLARFDQRPALAMARTSGHVSRRSIAAAYTSTVASSLRLRRARRAHERAA